MKKILFLGGLNSGGAEHQMTILASALSRKGYDVSFLYPGKSDFFKQILVDANVKLIPIKESGICSSLMLGIPYLIFAVYRVLRKEHFDTVISFLGLWNYVNCFTARFRATKHKAITGLRNSRDSVLLSKKDRYYTKYERNAAVKVCNSNNAKFKFANYFPEHKDKLVTIYNAVILPPMDSVYSPKSSGKVNIIVPASYRDVKNPLGLLEALKLLDTEFRSKLHIIWYGDIKSGRAVYDQMMHLIDVYQLNGVIELKDATTDIVNRMNEYDLVGLFSKSEGLPNAICEGMMLGKPVMMSRVSDYDVLINETNGLLFDWDDTGSITRALQSASTLSESQLTEMGGCSKKKAELLFSEEQIIKQWEQLL